MTISNVYRTQPLTACSGISELLDDIHPIYKKLVERNKIPSNCLAVRPTINDFEFIINELVNELSASYKKTEERLRGTSNDINFCLKTSTILKINNAPAGIFITYPLPTNREIYVYGVTVTKNWRKTWATVFLKYHSFKYLHKAGIKIIRYQIFEENKDTLKHANRVNSTFSLD